MAKPKAKAKRTNRSEKDAPEKGLAPASWALVAVGAVSLLLLYAGLAWGNWRGVVVSEIQVLVVGAAAWYGLR